MAFSRLSKLARAVAHSAGVAQPAAPGADVRLSEDVTVGDLVLEWLVARYGRENGAETINRCERLLQVLAPGEDGISYWQPVVLTTSDVLALTAPGRAIYITEGLLQMIGDDDAPLAFALAHELAHHRLGHVASGDGDRWRKWLGESAGMPTLAAAVINRFLFSPEQEYAADRDALAQCLRAGFDPGRCMVIFDVLERWQESGRELGVTFSGDWLSGTSAFCGWLRERVSGYPTLTARRETVEVERVLLEHGGI